MLPNIISAGWWINIIFPNIINGIIIPNDGIINGGFFGGFNGGL